MSNPGNRKVARLKQAIEGAVSLGERRKLERDLSTLEATSPVPKTLVACPHCDCSHWTDRLVGTGSFELCPACKEAVATGQNKSKRT